MIGLLPAAGQATRMNGLPKYLLPIPGGSLIQRHVDMMRVAGLTDCIREYRHSIFIPFRELSWNHAASYDLDGNMAYPISPTETMSETVLTALPGSESHCVLLGLPDTYFEDTQAYHKLADVLNDGAQLAVGLFRSRPSQHTKVGMCRIEGNRVTEVIDKPKSTDLGWLWGVLAWQPAFWGYIKPEDPHVGYAIPRAIAAGLDVRAVKMEGWYWDCGTPEEYFELITELTLAKAFQDSHGTIGMALRELNESVKKRQPIRIDRESDEA